MIKESEIWLKSGANLYLAAVLCANIRFLAEVLYYLDVPRKSNELNEIAVQEYGLSWKTISDINSRLVWLRHLEVPIKLSLYRKIFEKAGIADISLMDDDRQDIVCFGKLMRAVVSCLIAESEDPETEGFLFERDIYRSLRDSNKINNPPTMEAISNMLQFLSSPLVGCVEKTKDGYYATGSLSDVARKFAFYSRNCFDDQ